MKKILWTLALLALCQGAQAQLTPTKKELLGRVLQLEQISIERSAQALAERPAQQLMEQANLTLASRAPSDQRDALTQAIQADVRKYLDEAVPLVRERAVRLAPGTIGPALDDAFSEDELRQLVAIIESPVNRKYLRMRGELQQALAERVVADTLDVIEPKVTLLSQTLVKRLKLQDTAPPTVKSTPVAKSTPAAQKAKKVKK